jgi:hypothetical protein
VRGQYQVVRDRVALIYCKGSEAMRARGADMQGGREYHNVAEICAPNNHTIQSSIMIASKPNRYKDHKLFANTC